MIELSICIIARNEEENLDAALASVKGCADEIVVVDTGSTDRTTEVAERHGARVALFTPETDPDSFFRDDEATCAAFGAPPPYSGEVMLGDFGAARRKSFSLARGEFIYWMDSDDVVENADRLRLVVHDMKARNLDLGFLAYDYARDEQGRTFYRQWRERVVRNGAAVWVNPVHEVLMPTRPVQSGRFDGVTNIHRRKADRKSVPNRNYKILLRQLARDKASGAVVDPRTLFYLGQEARWVEPLKAEQFYEEYLRRSGWGEERAAAHVALGSMLEFGQLGGDPDEAYSRADREFATAAAEMPDNPDGLFGLARIAYLRGRWQDCVSYTERAMKIGNTESMLGANPLDRTYRPHVYLNHALSKLGRVEDAIASCKAALAVCPDDPGVPGGAPGMLKHNLAAYEAELAARRAPAPPAPAASPMVEFTKFEDLDAPPVQQNPDAYVIYAMQLWKQCAARGDEAGARGAVAAARWTGDLVVERMRAATDRRWPGLVEPKRIDEARDIARGWRPGDNPHIGGTLDSFLREEEIKDEVDKLAGRQRVAFWVGPSVEPWDPSTPNTRGIGGSETACAELARELARLGHEVRVYGDLPSQSDGVYNGVHYIHWQIVRAPIECDVFISSRQAAIMERPDDVRARVKLLWVHDVNVGPDSPQMQRWLFRFDRILCLSEWHRGYFLSCYPGLDPVKVLVTRNGINPARFSLETLRCHACGGGFSGGTKPCPVCNDQPVAKRNHLVFSSSPNRGLDTLVLNFPHVKARVPDAELHIYYGWDCWEAFARARGATDELAQIAQFKKFVTDRAHPGSGIHMHGRVGQRELAEAFMRAKVWPHWTQFTETSCISAMEAQAAGCVAVHSGVAALAETVKHGVKVESPQAFVDACVRALTDEPWRRSIAESAREWAFANLSWRALAAEWSEMFKRVEGELAADPLPKYMEVGR